MTFLKILGAVSIAFLVIGALMALPTALLNALFPIHPILGILGAIVGVSMDVYGLVFLERKLHGKV